MEINFSLNSSFFAGRYQYYRSWPKKYIGISWNQVSVLSLLTKEVHWHLLESMHWLVEQLRVYLLQP